MPEFNQGQLLWLRFAYTNFAKFGPDELKIDRMAGKLGKSRSSFYYSFGDLENFQNDLFTYHIMKCKEFAKESADIKVLYPDYINLIVKYKDKVFFEKQLLLHQHIDPSYGKLLRKALKFSEEKSTRLWQRAAGLEAVPTGKLVEFYLAVRDTLYTRIHYDTFTSNALFVEVQKVNASFKYLVEHID